MIAFRIQQLDLPRALFFPTPLLVSPPHNLTTVKNNREQIGQTSNNPTGAPHCGNEGSHTARPSPRTEAATEGKPIKATLESPNLWT